MHPHHSLRRLSYPTAYGVARDPLDGSARVRAESFLHRDATDDFHTGARPAVGPFDPAAVAERRAIHEQILAINRRLENLKGSLSDLTVRLGAHSATVTLPPPTESA